MERDSYARQVIHACKRRLYDDVVPSETAFAAGRKEGVGREDTTFLAVPRGSVGRFG